MSNETYYIPTNFTDAGRVMGLFEIRNMVEAVLLSFPSCTCASSCFHWP